MTDKIFLLSIEEYEKYRDNIPEINAWWWLRSPGNLQYDAAYVRNDGSVSYYGSSVNIDIICVRPALRLDSSTHKVGEKVCKCGYTWVVIDDDLAIAEMPIAIRRFDEYTYDYESSEIRHFLLDWYEEREDIFGV